MPWVADFRDAWTGRDCEGVPTGFHGRWNGWMVRCVLRTADRVVAVSWPITRDLVRLSGRSMTDVVTLPNGFDRADFEGTRSSGDEKFTITYCGTLSPMLNPAVFLRAAARAVQDHPGLRSNLRLRFVGWVYGVDLDRMVSEHGLEDVVDVVGYVSHRRSVEHLMASDLLLLLLPKDADEGMVTGKVFEYLGSGKPILAAVPRGEAARVILDYARGVVVSPDDAERMAAEIVRAYALWERGDLRITVPRWQGLEGLDRRNQAETLARMFDSVLS